MDEDLVFDGASPFPRASRRVPGAPLILLGLNAGDHAIAFPQAFGDSNTAAEWQLDQRRHDRRRNGRPPNKQGGGQAPSSWNAAHSSRGCSQQNLIGTGGNGYFYCFAN